MKKKEKITIRDLGRKKSMSEDTVGDFYTVTTILAEDGRIMKGFGEWTEDWEIGDTIEGNIKNKYQKSKKGNIKKTIIIKKPKS